MSIVKYFVWFFLSLFLFSCTDENKEEESKCESVVFIGDSLVRGWKVQNYFSSYNTENVGVLGAKLEDVFNWDIDVTDKTAVFLVGTNNLGGVASVSNNFYVGFVNLYLELIASLDAKQNIVISILPRVPAAHRLTINQEIIRLNAELKSAFSTHENILFLDVYDSFLDESGSVNSLYFYDGLHLSDKGYDLLSSLLSSVL